MDGIRRDTSFPMRARARTLPQPGNPARILSRPDGSADRRRRGGDVDATAVTTEDLKLK
jgi:hypothetical protein